MNLGDEVSQLTGRLVRADRLEGPPDRVKADQLLHLFSLDDDVGSLEVSLHDIGGLEELYQDFHLILLHARELLPAAPDGLQDVLPNFRDHARIYLHLSAILLLKCPVVEGLLPALALELLPQADKLLEGDADAHQPADLSQELESLLDFVEGVIGVGQDVLHDEL